MKGNSKLLKKKLQCIKRIALLSFITFLRHIFAFYVLYLFW